MGIWVAPDKLQTCKEEIYLKYLWCTGIESFHSVLGM